MKPFLNWAGGKRWLVAKHDHLFPDTPLRHIEPFVGSGAVFFHLEPTEALLADRNTDLIEAYAAVKDEPQAVLLALTEHKRKHSADYYYKVRASRPRLRSTRAARLIYLNRTCWNGLYRVNLRGEFNVPKGSKNTVVFPDDDFDAWAIAMENTQLVSQDFESTVAEAGEGDFLYVDPPYTVQHNNNNFVKYNEQIFSWSDQVRLAEALHSAASAGARVLISNADHPSIRALYRHPDWTTITVTRHARLAASASNRRRTTEVVIANYVDETGHAGEPRCCT